MKPESNWNPDGLSATISRIETKLDIVIANNTKNNEEIEDLKKSKWQMFAWITGISTGTHGIWHVIGNLFNSHDK